MSLAKELWQQVNSQMHPPTQSYHANCFDVLKIDGAGLFAGVIKYLIDLGDSCPLVFAATHFHEVLNPRMLSPLLPISFVHMAVMITTNDGDILMENENSSQDGDDSSARVSRGRTMVRPGESVTYLFK